jgi:hypothetical protein
MFGDGELRVSQPIDRKKSAKPARHGSHAPQLGVWGVYFGRNVFSPGQLILLNSSATIIALIQRLGRSASKELLGPDELLN